MGVQGFSSSRPQRMPWKQKPTIRIITIPTTIPTTTSHVKTWCGTGIATTFRVEPWQYNNQQGKKGNKGRDNQLETLRKQLQEERAANAKLKGIPEEPANMEVDQGMGEKSQQARKQEEAERNKKRISLAKKLTDTEWVLQWTKERQLPGTEGIH